MCLVCASVTQNPVCGVNGCPLSFWQQNFNMIITSASPVLGVIYLGVQNIWKKKILKKE